MKKSEQLGIMEGVQDCDIWDWLNGLDLTEYTHHFKQSGFDSLQFIKVGIEDEDDLKEIDIKALGHRRMIMHAIRKLKNQNDEGDEDEDDDSFDSDDMYTIHHEPKTTV